MFSSGRLRPKRRVHFHEVWPGARAHAARASSRAIPSDGAPARRPGQPQRICFDELHVHDIDDARSCRLFTPHFDSSRGWDSNVAPGELYKNGLNRALFLPFIDLIGEHMELEELLAAKDFRLDKLAGKSLYFTPADAHARSQMNRLWGELTGHHPGAAIDLDVKGRKVRVPQASMGVARFGFAELCEQPLGANDYLHMRTPSTGHDRRHSRASAGRASPPAASSTGSMPLRHRCADRVPERRHPTPHQAGDIPFLSSAPPRS